MIDLVYQSYDPDVPADGYWDMGLINELVAGKLWNAVGLPEFERKKSLADVRDGAVIVFPARRQVQFIHELNRDLERLKWAVVILVGDEANEFPAHLINHPNMKLWIMSPSPKHYVPGARKIGSGFPPQAREWLPQYKEDAYNKPVDYFFAGQITHGRRLGMRTELETMEEFKPTNHIEGVFLFTEGFTQGMQHEMYYKGLAASKVAPCPAGPESPDSFRLYEALEAGCIPIVDAISPRVQFTDYWTWFFDEEPPFPVYTEYSQIRGYITDGVESAPAKSNRIFAWWQNKKRDMAYWLVDDIASLNPHKAQDNQRKLRDMVTVIMPTSPVKSHPDTSMIEQTIRDIRVHLPDAEIIITVDGIREEQEHYREAYTEYTKRLLWLANHEWHNVLPIVFDEHMHQASMCREALKRVKTPLILYAEHDTPLTPDRPIQWDRLVRCVLDGTANVIRFNHESLILEEHKHLILSEAENHHGALLTKTQQWSQRPHLASTAFYNHMIGTYFHPESKTMIEDVIHQKVEIDMRAGGEQAWFNWRIWLYTPDSDPDGSILRSYNLDGRGDDPKFDMEIKPTEDN
jgi:hypothetical protein